MKPKSTFFSLPSFSKGVFQSLYSRLLFIIEVSCSLRGKKRNISLTGPPGSSSLSLFFETMLLICVSELILNPSLSMQIICLNVLYLLNQREMKILKILDWILIPPASEVPAFLHGHMQIKADTFSFPDCPGEAASSVVATTCLTRDLTGYILYSQDTENTASVLV